MEKKKYISPEITIVRCETEGIMEFSNTETEDNTNGNANITNGGSSDNPDELNSKENSGALWNYEY